MRGLVSFALIRRAVAVAAMVALGLLIMSGTAYGATAAWTQQTPSPGSVTDVSPSVISVRVTGTNPLWTSLSNHYIKVDGRTLRIRLTFDRNPDGTYDYTKCVVSGTPSSPLATGVHRVEASVFDGIRHKTTWSFSVGPTPPTIAGLSPAPGTVVPTTEPVIEALIGGTPIANVVVRVDGSIVPSTFSMGTVRAYPSLANDTDHSILVTATGVNGMVSAASSTFTVLEKMQAPDDLGCTGCHPSYPAAHPVDDCAACHGVGSPIGGDYTDPADSHAPGTRCAACHGNLQDCTYCHDADYATVPPLHSYSADAYHISTSSGCSGEGCHSLRLSIAHDYPERDCMTCHGASASQPVKDAIAAEDTACGSCHIGAAGHLSVHTGTISEACSECHGGNLVTEHVTDRALSCSTCHDSVDPAVQTAIADGVLACTACHGANAGSHAAVHDGTVDPACADCHAGNLVTEHTDNPAITCATCHDSVDPAVQTAIADGVLACTACHGAGAGAHTAVHDTDIAGCADCHAGNLVTEHTDNPTITCATCHESTDPAVLAAIAANNRDCLACHDFGSHPYTPSLHQGGVASMTISGTVSGIPFSGQSCGQCHLMDLAAEHAKASSSVASDSCNACHAAPRDTFTDWNQTCQQGGCHASYHGGMAVKHAETYSTRLYASGGGCGASSVDCHDGFWPIGDLAGIHNAAWNSGGVFTDISAYTNGCTVCHTNNQRIPPASTACSSCHVAQHGAANFPW